MWSKTSAAVGLTSAVLLAGNVFAGRFSDLHSRPQKHAEKELHRRQTYYANGTNSTSDYRFYSKDTAGKRPIVLHATDGC